MDVVLALVAGVLVGAALVTLAWTRTDRGTVTRLERAAARQRAAGDEQAVTTRRLREALDAIPEGIVICDGGGRVVFRNRAAAGFAGARHGDALVAAAVDQLIRSALSGTPERRELDLFGPPRRSVVISGAPLDVERPGTGALAVIDDVTERRRLEAMRTDFVANISHELKTPVGALALLAETILMEDDDAVRRRLAERMLGEAERVGRTIDDLLDLSRIEAERRPMREPLPVHLVLADSVERVRGLAEQRGVRLVADEPDGRLTVVGDRRQLVSALTNLLENAVKYSDRGSTVEVEATADGRAVELVVRDHGIGIPARDLERVFERFYRVDRARSRETGGTGLGLAIVRHVANNHRGEVRVHSVEGEGSTFVLRLPAGTGAAVVPAPDAVEAT